MEITDLKKKKKPLLQHWEHLPFGAICHYGAQCTTRLYGKLKSGFLKSKRTENVTDIPLSETKPSLSPLMFLRRSNHFALISHGWWSLLGPIFN